MTVLSILLLLLTVLDYLPLHDIRRDYVSRAALAGWEDGRAAALPEWTTADLEWSAVAAGLYLKAALAAAGAVLGALLLREERRATEGLPRG
jgi:hypothetical protein